MNQQQAETLLTNCQEALKLDFVSVIRNAYPGRDDLQNVMISQMKLEEFMHYSNRVFSRFEEVLQDRPHYLILPLVFNHMSGQVNINDQVNGFITHVRSGKLINAENNLLIIINYQVNFGIFNSSTVITDDRGKAVSAEIGEKLKLLTINIENTLQKVNETYEEIGLRRQEIQNLISQKRTELESISSNLSTSTSQSGQIADLLNKSTEQATKISVYLEQQENLKAQFEKNLHDFEDRYKRANDEITANNKTVITQIEEFKGYLDRHAQYMSEIDSKKSFFDERINYLQNLIGQEVGASLFKTFNQRKAELSSPVLFWTLAVPIMTVITIIYVFCLFYALPEINDLTLWWQAFAVNSLKAIPAMILLYFTVSQYRKERNFQEEYAFKSAVALTIDAYADRLKSDENRDKLIIESVLSVYKTPIPQKTSGLWAIWPRSANENLMVLAEAAKEVLASKK